MFLIWLKTTYTFCLKRKSKLMTWKSSWIRTLYCDWSMNVLDSVGTDKKIVPSFFSWNDRFNVNYYVLQVYSRKGLREKLGVQKENKDSQTALVFVFIISGYFIATSAPLVADSFAWKYLYLTTGINLSTDIWLKRVRQIAFEVRDHLKIIWCHRLTSVSLWG